MSEVAKMFRVSFSSIETRTIDLKIILFVLFSLVTLPSCQDKEMTKNLSPEDVALLIIEYTLTLNQSGFEELLCADCSINPYRNISNERRMIAEAFEKNDVDITDRNAHNLRDIKCSIVSRDEGSIHLKCRGKYILLKKYRSFFDASFIDREIILKIEGNRLTDCPPVCSLKNN